MDETDYATLDQLVAAQVDLAHNCVYHRGATLPVIVTVTAANGSNITQRFVGDLAREGEPPIERVSYHQEGDGFCWPLVLQLIDADGCVRFAMMHPRDGSEKVTLVYEKAIMEDPSDPAPRAGEHD
jgi:hypothetical protein